MPQVGPETCWKTFEALHDEASASRGGNCAWAYHKIGHQAQACGALREGMAINYSCVPDAAWRRPCGAKP